MITENIQGKTVNYEFVTRYIPDVMNAMYNEQAAEPLSLFEIRDAFRVKQMQSKAWLLSQVRDLSKDKRILVIGSWIGFTSWCLYKLGFKYITEVDPDARLEQFAKHLNRHNADYRHITDDVNNLDLSQFDTIINTSCEHILDNSWFDKIPAGARVYLHSNNLEGYDHVNTCTDVGDMSKKYPLNFEFQGTLDFQDWKRFMLIGTKQLA